MFVTRARALVESSSRERELSFALTISLSRRARALLRSHDFFVPRRELSFALTISLCHLSASSRSLSGGVLFFRSFLCALVSPSGVFFFLSFFWRFFVLPARGCGRHWSLRSARKGYGGAGVLWLPRSMVGSQCDSRSGGSTFGIVRARLWYDATVPGNCSAVRAGEWYE